MQIVEEKAHSEFGASAAHRWMVCPGSVALNQNMPNYETPYTKEGTLAHELAEWILRKETRQLHGMKKPKDIPPEMQEYVEEYTNVVLGELNRCQVKQASKIDLHVEEKIHITFDQRLFGTVDASFYCAQEGRIYVFDLKYGQGVPVSVHNNKQLLYYALASWKRRFAREVKLTIVQPRIPGETIKSVNYSVEDMELFEEQLKRAVHQVDSEPYKFIPGPKQCEWCQAMAICPAQSHSFTAVTEIEPTVKENNPLPAITDMSNDQLSLILQNKKRFEKWLNEVASMASRRLEEGKEIPGFKMVNKISREGYKDHDALLRKLCEENDVKNWDEFANIKLKTPKQMRDNGWAEQIEGETERKTSGTTMVPSTDRRKEVKSQGFLPENQKGA